MARSSSDESSIVAVGLVIILICLGGSHATGTSPLRFFFTGFVLLIFGSLFLAVAFGFVLSVIRIWVEAHKQDGRTLWQIIREEYSAKGLAKTYGVVGGHMHKHLSVFWDSKYMTPIRRMAGKTGTHTKGAAYKVKEFWHFYRSLGNDSGDDDPYH